MKLLRILVVIWLALGLPLATTGQAQAHPCGDLHAKVTDQLTEPAPAATAMHHHGHHPTRAAGQAADAGKTNPAGHAHHGHDQTERNCCASHGCCDSGLCARQGCSASPTLLLQVAQQQHPLAGPAAEHPTAPRLRPPAPGFHATPIRPPA